MKMISALWLIVLVSFCITLFIVINSIYHQNALKEDPVIVDTTGINARYSLPGTSCTCIITQNFSDKELTTRVQCIRDSIIISDFYEKTCETDKPNLTVSIEYIKARDFIDQHHSDCRIKYIGY